MMLPTTVFPWPPAIATPMPDSAGVLFFDVLRAELVVVGEHVAGDPVVARLVGSGVEVDQADAVVVGAVPHDLAVRGVPEEEAEEAARHFVPGDQHVGVR